MNRRATDRCLAGAGVVPSLVDAAGSRGRLSENIRPRPIPATGVALALPAIDRVAAPNPTAGS
jgi:hypothetical protein